MGVSVLFFMLDVVDVAQLWMIGGHRVYKIGRDWAGGAQGDGFIMETINKICGNVANNIRGLDRH